MRRPRHLAQTLRPEESRRGTQSACATSYAPIANRYFAPRARSRSPPGGVAKHWLADRILRQQFVPRRTHHIHVANACEKETILGLRQPALDAGIGLTAPGELRQNIGVQQEARHRSTARG